MLSQIRLKHHSIPTIYILEMEFKKNESKILDAEIVVKKKTDLSIMCFAA